MKRIRRWNRRLSWKRIAQWTAVLGFAFTLKLFYSNANANQLKWVLGPTTAIVELVSSRTFEFEDHAGYLSSDRSFLIAPSCAGVNFLIAAFVMLAASKLCKDRSREVAWGFLPAAAFVAYIATLAANTVRIALALQFQQSAETGFLSLTQVHRFEGIVVYFLFLLLLFVISEGGMSSAKPADLLKRSALPLVAYYGTMLGIPLLNGAYSQGSRFWEHSLAVLVIPLLLLLIVTAFRLLLRGSGRVLESARQ